jgi:hypothetical protein
MTDVIIPSLKVNPEFQTLIPPLTDDEYKRLETSLVNNGWEGWRGPILVWDGVIVDGHNRYRICQEYGIAFTTKEMHFSGEDSAKLFIIDNQLKRRNLPPAAIGDLKLEEKEIVARQAKERMQEGRNQYSPRPNLAQGQDSGKTLEILARDIPMGRESLRKLDVIKQKAKEGDPVAISEREALISGKKKSIHGAYVRVVGREQRSPAGATGKDGRRICAMCGEPIDDGDALPSRPTVHKWCEKEYQRDWERERRNDSADHDLLNNKPVYTVDMLLDGLASSVNDLHEAWTLRIENNESMGVRLTDEQKDRLNDAVSDMLYIIECIRKEQNNG